MNNSKNRNKSGHPDLAGNLIYPEIVGFYQQNKKDASLIADYFTQDGYKTVLLDYADTALATISTEKLLWRLTGNLPSANSSSDPQTIDFSNTKVIFVYDWRETMPLIPMANPTGPWHSWRDDYLVQHQNDSFFRSFLNEAQRRKILVVNPVSVLYLQSHLPALLLKLKKAGCPIADFIVTNDPKQAEHFLGKQSGLWRPATGQAPWQHIDYSICRDILKSQPRIIARAGAGAWLFVFGTSERALAIIEVTPPNTSFPESLETYSIWEPAPETDELCQIVGKTIGANYFCLHGLYHDRAGFRIFDVELTPLITHLPERIRQILAQRAGQAIVELSAHTPSAPFQPFEFENSKLARPTIYLRRMLSNLFDVERMRYRNSKIYNRPKSENV